MTEKAPTSSTLKRVRMFVWILVVVAVAGTSILLLMRSAPVNPQERTTVQSSFGGPFTLVDSNGKPFSSEKLLGRPYAMYFGFTRCGDICPTTLSRLVKLRQQLGSEDKFNIVFITIDPASDGPKEVGQYATLFDSPIIGLTGTQTQIDAVKKQFGIYAQPQPNAPTGQQMTHSAIVLLFDRAGKFVTTISPDEPDPDALAKLRQLVG